MTRTFHLGATTKNFGPHCLMTRSWVKSSKYFCVVNMKFHTEFSCTTRDAFDHVIVEGGQPASPWKTEDSPSSWTLPHGYENSPSTSSFPNVHQTSVYLLAHLQPAVPPRNLADVDDEEFDIPHSTPLSKFQTWMQTRSTTTSTSARSSIVSWTLAIYLRHPEQIPLRTDKYQHTLLCLGVYRQTVWPAYLSTRDHPLRLL